MKKLAVSLCVVMLALATLHVVNVQALDFGKKITAYDGLGQADEDGEVALNCVNSQEWDLEGMFLKGTELSLVGGFDFANGEKAPYGQVYSGDIFIDVTGDIVYGQNITGLSGDGNQDVNENKFGYDYVLSLNFNGSALTYDVYKIDQTANLTMGWYRQNDTSGAWKYNKSGGTLFQSGLIGGYQSGLSNADTGFGGGLHNALSLDLSFLGSNQNFTAQFTIGCGNDAMIGKGTTPVVATPEPGTLALVGLGLLGAVMLKRKNRK